MPDLWLIIKVTEMFLRFCQGLSELTSDNKSASDKTVSEEEIELWEESRLLVSGCLCHSTPKLTELVTELSTFSKTAILSFFFIEAFCCSVFIYLGSASNQ